MEYIKTTNLNLDTTYFHFSKIANRNSIEQNGIHSVAGGENNAGNDVENPTIYFSYGADGVLKAVDAWIKWEYDKLRKQKGYKYSPTEKINPKIMNEVYKKIYEDFKDRNYYSLDLIEGNDPETSDFSFTEIDKKKELTYNKYLYNLEQYKKGKTKCKPNYPPKDMAWKYGSYSNFENGNITLDSWNLNTHIGDKTIPNGRFKIIESENGRTDGLSIVFELYNKYRKKLIDIDFGILDNFMEYAGKRYQSDEDYTKNNYDIGRRKISPAEEKRYALINRISVSPNSVIRSLNSSNTTDTTQTSSLHPPKEGR